MIGSSLIGNVEPGSFRDRNGRVYYFAGKVFRGMSVTAKENFRTLTEKGFFNKSVTEGRIVSTELIDPAAEGVPTEFSKAWAAVVRHQAIPFVSYPYEWSFGMLKDAALLQLDLLADALKENMIIKDSSPYNVQWVGARPIFIDIPSFEVFVPGELWIGYYQFCQLFLYPLMLQAYKDVEFHPWLRGQIDGIDPLHMERLMSLRDRLRPGVFSHVYLLAKLQGRFGDTQTEVRQGIRNSGFRKELIEANVSRLRKLVGSLEWNRASSTWSRYAKTHSYTDKDQKKKASFVEAVSSSRKWKLAWDIGCNTGTFSRIASKHAEYVLAMDSDHLAVEHLYQALKKNGTTNILPLVVNVVDPTPNLGWQGKERKEIALRGVPDLVLCLALIHHIVIAANVPLEEFVRWLASIGASVVVEFVTKNDPMVRKLLRNKEDKYADYEVGFFEKYLDELFEVRRREEMGSGTRILYFAEPRRRG